MTGIALGAAFLTGAAFGWAAVLAVSVLAAGRVVFARRAPAIATGVVLLAALLGAWRGAPSPAPTPLAWADGADGVKGSIVSVPVRRADSWTYTIAVDRVRASKRWGPATGRLNVFAPAWPAPGWGDRVTLYGSVTALDDESPATQSYLRSIECGGSMFARSAYRDDVGHGWRRQIASAAQALDAVLARAAPGDAGALMAGLVTGDDRMLSPARRGAFRATGTSHITAVSGSNCAFLVVILSTAGGAAGWRRRLLWQTLTIAAVFGYALLAGFQPPAARAGIVAAGAILAGRFGRRADCVTLLVLAAALMVALDPTVLWSVSFQLSFASAFALAAVLAGSPRPSAAWVAEAGLAVVAAQLATLPILAHAGLALAPAAFPANVLIGPAVEIAFPLSVLTAVVGLALPAAASALALPATAIVRYAFLVVDAFGRWHPGVARESFQGFVNVMLAVVGIVAIVAMSRDGRRWVVRTVRRTRAREGDGLAAFAGAGAGAAIVVAGYALTR